MPWVVALMMQTWAIDLSVSLHKGANTLSSVVDRDSLVEGVWLVPLVGLVSMRRALMVLRLLRTSLVLAGLGCPGAVGVPLFLS